MEAKPINSFRPAPYNPRILDTHDAESLDRSINRWGDIAGITANITTGNYATGHQRINILRGKFGDERVKIVVTERLEQPDEYHTVARGHVMVEGTNIRLSYREIAVSEAEEKSLNVAANRVSGRFDIDLLAELNKELAQLEDASDLLEASGQTEEEVRKMIDEINKTADPDTQPDEPEKLSFKLTREQREVVDEAIGNIVATKDIPAEDQSSRSGSALYYMSRDYLDRLHGLTESQPPQPADPQPQPTPNPEPQNVVDPA